MSRGDRSRQTTERTPEEREQARLERERRRARRTGAPEPVESPPTEASLEPPAAEVSFEPEWEAPPQALPPESPPPFEPEAEPVPFEPEAEQEASHAEESGEPAWEGHEALTRPDVEQPLGDPVHEEPLDDPHPRDESEPPLYASASSSAPAGEPGHRRDRRSIPSRVAAAVALAGVLLAVVLLARSLGHTGSSGQSTTAPAVVKVVIPEGETRLQIARIAKRAHLSGDYLAASRRSPLLDPSHYGAPAATRDLEGFLFPDTYDMNAGEPVGRLVEAQLVAFREHFGISEIQRAHALRLTPYQLLIVASMIEREAQVSADRAKIAAVIYNRLRQRMPLAIDATLYYALAQRSGISVYGHELTEAELHMSSAYNTRTHAGLPPTPIANPGAASIQAAAHPARAPYLYYVLAPDGCGEHVFSTTAGEFEADAAAYRAALHKHGGRLPACKRKR